MPHTLLRHRSAPPRPRPQLGFTLVELLVAMLLGLITVLVVAQVMLMTESRKRTTTSGSDATVNGALALYTIERDARNAGYGMTTNPAALGCQIKTSVNGTPGSLTLSPVVITQGATTGAPDTIEFMASTKEGIALPVQVTDKHNEKDAQFQVDSRLGIAVNDLMVAIPDELTGTNWCSMFQVTDLPGSSANVLHNSGKSIYNPPGGSTIFPPGGYAKGSSLINLGAFSRRFYSIANNGLNLSQFDTLTATISPARLLYPHIIQLQAEYGTDTDLSDDAVRVTSWTTTTPTTAAGWAAVKAIRVAVVARSDVYEKEVVTIASTDADCTDPAKRSPRAVCWAGGAIKVKASDTDTEWDHYRYRVYEAVMPIRNVIWREKP